MAVDPFVHLHVHTEYSMLDGAAKVGALMTETKRLEMPAVAMTDHGNMFGADEFYQQAKKAGIKPIIGIEAYLAPHSRHHKKPVFWGEAKQRSTDEYGEGGDVSGAGAYTHMTMFARNATGLRNLFTLSSLASFEGQYRKPRMDRELISEHAEGIIATTGCPSGEVQTRLRLGQYREALQAAADYRDIFGQENFYLELMDHGLAIERSVRENLLKIGKELGLTPVATNDSHYVTEDQAESHAALLCVQAGKTLHDENRFKFDGAGYYLKSAEEMRDYWDAEVPGAAEATLEIAERVESYEDVFTARDRMPRVQVPAGSSEAQLLREEVERYLPERFPGGISQDYRDRIDYELEVICSKGYASYFMIVGDAVRWVKSRGGIVGPGRGSATGALVSYVLQIIDLDPIRHSLIFERFLNPERDSPPDIDLDFDDASRDAVMRYVADKYGEEQVAQVGTYTIMKTRGAIKDAARVQLGQPGFALAESMIKSLPAPEAAVDVPLDGIVNTDHPRYPEAAEFRSLLESNAEAQKVFDIARGLEGLVRGTSVHACAVILSTDPLREVVPMQLDKDGNRVTGWEYTACEDVGLLKMDFLGVKTLSVVNDAITAVRENYGVKIDLATLDLDDPAPYELLSTGNALGVFQLDGAGARNLLRQIAPTHFGDISAALALNRPGPLAAGAHTAYAERSNGREKISPIHPELGEALEPILAETYHLLVYQEQVMAITQQLAGYSLGAADKFRKAMGKKDADVLAKEKAKFVSGMTGNGFSDEATQTLWNVIEPFSGYAFNKSHTAGYGVVSYWCAYLKAHYPAEFMAAQLTNYGNDKDKAAVYLAECRRLGVQVLTPDVNESGVSFRATDPNTIRFGLGSIRGLGETPARRIVEARDEHGRFGSFEEFLQAMPSGVLTKKSVDALIKSGGFDSLGYARMGLSAVHEDAVDALAGLKRAAAEGQFDLFGDAEPDVGASPLAHLTIGRQEWPRKQLLAYEREMLGLYVSAHPLDGASRILRRTAPRSIAQLVDDAPAEGEATIAGLITSVDRRINKKGEPWAIVTVEDLHASLEVVFFARSYAVVGTELDTDAVVAVKGRINWRNDTMNLIGNDLAQLDVSEAEHNPAGTGPDPFVLRADASVINRDTVITLRKTLEHYPGSRPVHVQIPGEDGTTTLDLPDYPVEVTGALMGELKGLSGISVAER